MMPNEYLYYMFRSLDISKWSNPLEDFCIDFKTVDYYEFAFPDDGKEMADISAQLGFLFEISHAKRAARNALQETMKYMNDYFDDT